MAVCLLCPRCGCDSGLDRALSSSSVVASGLLPGSLLYIEIGLPQGAFGLVFYPGNSWFLFNSFSLPVVLYPGSQICIQSNMAKAFSKDEVSSHSKPDNLWVVIDEDVYDLTQFQEEHPGRF